MTFKNHQVLKDISWEVKKGERVGLVGVNGAGKTTQLQVITGALEPDTGEVRPGALRAFFWGLGVGGRLAS